MLSIWLGSDKYQFLSYWVDSTRVQNHYVQIHRSAKTGDGHSTHSAIRSGVCGGGNGGGDGGGYVGGVAVVLVEKGGGSGGTGDV